MTADAFRILVIDDNAAIRDLFHAIFTPRQDHDDEFARLQSQLLGEAPKAERGRQFAVDLAANGREGHSRLAQAHAEGQPYAAAFVDMRMPGWDGLTTVEALWRVDPELQVVLCSAYSDYAWDDMAARLGNSDRWLVLKKPFDVVEVKQMAAGLAARWELQRQQRRHVRTLEQDVDQKLRELQCMGRRSRIISQCNEVLVSSGSERELGTALCERLVADGDYACARVELFAEAGQPQAAPFVTEARARGAAPAAPVELSLGRPDGAVGTLSIAPVQGDTLDEAELHLLQELATNVAYGISSLRYAADRDRLERELAYLANYDRCTGLPNRVLFRDRLRQAIALASRGGRQVAAMVIALDRLQSIREVCGDDIAQEVLTVIGQRLVASVRAGDSTAYLGGDEFALAVTDLADADDLPPLADKLLQELARPLTVMGRDLVTTASIGVSLSASDGEDADLLVRNAASAAHVARAEGGHVLRFYAPSMNERTAARLALQADLHQALEAGELVVYFQPKVNARNGSLTGAEALLRWQHPRLGTVPPGDFIPQAEDCGIILPIGAWVIRAVCSQLRAWKDEGLPMLPVAINVSARQFRQANLVGIVREALAESGLDPRQIELEITEGTLMEDLEASTAILRDLKSIGIRLTLDDFGTGYSSLSYLQHFPMDQIKIDRSFVTNITVNTGDAAICRSVIEMAHALGMHVVAEGVETEGQMNYLRRRGCDQFQGYYFSRPLTGGDYGEMLRRGQHYVVAQPGDGPARTLLAVDDEPHILSAIKRLCRREDFRVLTAESAEAALDILARHDVQVVLSDQRMPSMNGTDFLARVRALYPDTVRIILSGYTDLDTVVNAINVGTLFRFLTKPWDGDVLLEHLHEAFAYHEMGRARVRATEEA